MVNRALPAADLPAGPAGEGCCPPIGVRPMEAGQAVLVAPMFKALGDPVRLRLMSMIASAPEICVCDLTSAFDLSGPTISHHLRVLREAGLVDAERRGTWVWYRIRVPAFRQLGALLDVSAAPAA
jgi:ArsR family transcriptional regulator, arsenate/arsenite/antimonite-responsive transcriptional repressor